MISDTHFSFFTAVVVDVVADAAAVVELATAGDEDGRGGGGR